METTKYIAGYFKHKLERKFSSQSVYKVDLFGANSLPGDFFLLKKLFMIIKIQLFLVYEAGEGVRYI